MASSAMVMPSRVPRIADPWSIGTGVADDIWSPRFILVTQWIKYNLYIILRSVVIGRRRE